MVMQLYLIREELLKPINFGDNKKNNNPDRKLSRVYYLLLNFATDMLSSRQVPAFSRLNRSTRNKQT